MLTRRDVFTALLALAIVVFVALVRDRLPDPARTANAAVLDPCPVLLVRTRTGHIQALSCAVFLPSVVVSR